MAQVGVILADLQSHDLLVMDNSASAIVYAYPFAGQPTDHRVELSGRELYAVCAIDALGVAGMFRRDTTIKSTCRACGIRIEIGTDRNRFSEGEFDVVYLYSVFSHLNEATFLAMLRETARVVRPGGFVLFTTVPPSEDFVRRRGFPESWKADADAGRYLFVPTGGAHVAMPSSVWGWALVSEPYLRRVSADFPFELAAYHPDHLSQAFVALRRLP